MSSEIIVIIVLTAIAVLGLGWLEIHSRRQKRNRKEERPEAPADPIGTTVRKRVSADGD